MIKMTVQFYEVETLIQSLTVVSKLSVEAASYIKEHFLETISDYVTWGDAERTLVKGSQVRKILLDIASEYQEAVGETVTLILPNDLHKTLVAFDG